MENGLQKQDSFEKMVNKPGMIQQAEKITNVGEVHTMKTGDITNNIFVAGTSTAVQPALSGNFGTSREFYSLFVQGEEEFYSEGYFYVRKDRALNTTLTSDFIRREGINELKPEDIEMIKTFPAIFCAENHQKGKTDDQQLAYYGFVTDIKVQDNGIKVYYRTFNPIRQQTLNEIRFGLCIDGTEKRTELNYTHWAIKRVDLVSALREHDIHVLTLS